MNGETDNSIEAAAAKNETVKDAPSNEDENAKQVKEWQEELDKTEKEAETLRLVLVSKQSRIAELKKLLGRNVLTDVRDKVKTIGDSEVIVKTNQAFKSAGEKTSAAFSNLGRKFGDVKWKINERMNETIRTAKRSKSLFSIGHESRVSGARSSQSDNESLTPATPPTTPTTDQQVDIQINDTAEN